MVSKDLNYYLSLDFNVSVRRNEDEDGVYYIATCRELDPKTFYGYGSTKVEALESFENSRKEVFKIYFDKGFPIAEPAAQETESYSGKFIVRTSPRVHSKLVEMAVTNRKSLNALVDEIFVRFISASDISEYFETTIIDSKLTIGYMHTWLLKSESHHSTVVVKPDFNVAA